MPCAYKPKDKTIGDCCQFEVNDDELTKLDGKDWCEFHLPMADENGNASDKAEWNRERVKEFNVRIYELIRESETEKCADFRGVVFPDLIRFNNIKHNNFIFNEATFNNRAHFESATLNYHADFKGATFNGVAHFAEVAFNGGVRFNGARFNREAWFKGATFNGDADFKEVTFKGTASFEANLAHSNDSSTNTRDCFNRVNFNGAKFDKGVSFMNRRFLHVTDFRNGYFEMAPNFHNCELHQDTRFAYRDFRDTKSEGAPAAYRTLMLAMEKVRASNKQAMFFALEQKSIRAQKGTPIWVKFSSWMYEKTSNYGQSALRPLLCLGVNLLAFSLIYFAANWNAPCTSEASLCTQPCTTADTLCRAPNGMAVAFHMSMEQIVRPFYIWATKLETTSLGIKLAATFQSILSITFITLFVLALRWRFRKG